MANVLPNFPISPLPTRQIYLVVSQTGTVPSRILKAATGAKYNHVSISLSPDLTRMYSFGRRHPYNPFWGGFVVESPNAGTFKRFPNTKAMVLSLTVSHEAYDGIARTIDDMLSEQTAYHYNYLGVILGGLQIQYQKNKAYYCSEFVKDLLLRNHVKAVGRLPAIVQPIHFLGIPGGSLVYCGYLRDYQSSENEAKIS